MPVIPDARSQAISHVRDVYPSRLRPPSGTLRHPFVDPGTGYDNLLWDWDAYFCLLGLEPLAGEDPAIGRHARGCVDNFLDAQAEDGCVPYSLHPAKPLPGPRRSEEVRNPCKPLLAQFALLAERCGGGDAAWLAHCLPRLERAAAHWFETQGCRYDLLTWRSHRGSGTDNHPAYFQRPHNSVADPFLNALMVLECQALAVIAGRCGGDAAKWSSRADVLAAAIERWLWDPIDGTYYAIDVGRGDPGAVRTPVDWAVPLKFRSWVMVLPLFAGVAAPERARRVVHAHVLPVDQLRSRHGMRSLARVEPAYHIFRDFNPSDWLGPVWVVATWLGIEALRRAGEPAAANALRDDLLATLATDLAATGTLHEYYDPEDGRGLMHPGFLNWNTLALRLALEP